MLRRFIMTAAVGAVVSLVAGVAQAELITFQFEGVVNTVIDPNNVLGGDVVVGDSVSGAYSFDSAAPDEYPNDPTYGMYATTPPFIVHLGSFSWTSSGEGRIRVGNAFNGDGYSAWSLPSTSGAFRIVELGFTLGDPSATALSRDHLLLSPPILQAFSERTFWVLKRGRS